jgi:hypothetical protein
VGAGGGFGESGVYTTTLLGSTDVSTHIVTKALCGSPTSARRPLPDQRGRVAGLAADPGLGADALASASLRPG